ncbi:hypothetical protein [Actinophytocola sp.]|uniref:hypothetical protein n=1 Tax=Actinophytocola sp. TaxID=1872138 RepID=UPI00389A8D4F
MTAMDGEGTQEPTLFACEDCGKYYVLLVDSTKQECPSGHDYMPVVKSSSAHYDRATCLNGECEDLLRMDLQITRNKHERCGKNTARVLSTLVDGYGTVTDATLLKYVYTAPQEEQGVHAARSLEAAINETEGFKTSHHSDKGGRHNPTASARHDRGDKEDANIRRRKKETLKRLIADLKRDVPDWQNNREVSAMIEKAERLSA